MRDVRHFLMDAEERIDDPIELAAHALAELIEGDTGPMDRTVCVAVIDFLDQNRDPPSSDPTMEHRGRELIELVREVAADTSQYREWALQQYREWALKWYP